MSERYQQLNAKINPELHTKIKKLSSELIINTLDTLLETLLEIGLKHYYLDVNLSGDTQDLAVVSPEDENVIAPLTNSESLKLSSDRIEEYLELRQQGFIRNGLILTKL